MSLRAQAVVGWLTCIISLLIFVIVGAKGSGYGVCLVATVLAAAAFALGLALEMLTKPSPSSAEGLFSEPDPLRDPRVFVAARLLLIFSLVTGTFVGPYVLFETDLVIVNCVLFLIALCTAVSLTLSLATKRRVASTYVSQERGVSTFRPGDRIRQYREFAYSSLFFSLLPCITAHGSTVSTLTPHLKPYVCLPMASFHQRYFPTF